MKVFQGFVLLLVTAIAMAAFAEGDAPQVDTPTPQQPLGVSIPNEFALFENDWQHPPTPEPLGPEFPPELQQYAADWPTAQGNLAGTRAALNSAIDSSNVAQLEVAWTFKIAAVSGWGGMTAPPLIAGNTVYIQDMGSNVFALNRDDGRMMWKREYNVNTTGPNGLALGYGRIFGTLGDTAEVFSLDATTGEELWRSKLTGNTGEGIDIAPVVYNSTVYVSTAPSNGYTFYRGGQKGVLFALDANSGSVLWQFDTTNNLWGNPRINSGGGLWYPPSIDASGNLYFGTGNPGPWPGTEYYPNGMSRPGDNDYASSMVSLNPQTGAVRWYVNAKPHDLFDHDFQNTPILVTVQSDVEVLKLAIGSGKTGEVIAADANTGEIVWRTNVGAHQNDRLTELPLGQTLKVLPGMLGGVETPISYGNGMVFVPVVNLSTLVTSVGFVEGSADLSQARGELVALDVRDGTVRWKVDLPQGPFGGTTVANDVVFVSTIDGVFAAYDVMSGELIWTYQASAGFNAPPAIAGDMVIVGAAAARIPSALEPTSTPTAADATPEAQTEPVAELIAFRLKPLGGTATPTVNDGP
jgi:glucose dehydrogenase